MPFPFTAQLFVDRYLNGVRIDTFLSRHFRNYTPFRLQRLIRAGQVKVHGETIELQHRVYVGQVIEVRLIEPPDKLLEPQDIPLDVLFEDPWLLVINKPAGLIVHPGGLYQTGTLINAVQHHLDRQTPLRGLMRPGVVHRLDRQTSGVMVVPKEHLAHRGLGMQFENERVSKSYVALVDGVMPHDRGTISFPLGFAPNGKNVLSSAKADAVDVRPAKTRYEVLTRFREHTLVRAKPATGRLHQIRVHFAELGFPVVADEFYSKFGEIKPLPAFDEEDEDPAVGGNGSAIMQRHALHAHRLAFSHPITSEWMEFEAPLAADLRQAVERLQATR